MRLKQDWTIRVVLRYALLQVPGAALLVVLLIAVQQWVDLPAWFVWGLVALWVAKDVILFPFLWRAYDWDRSRDGNSMIGIRGTAKERLAPSGYVKVRGELWLAEVTENGRPIEIEEAVYVTGIRGLTLLVTPVNKDALRSRDNEECRFRNHLRTHLDGPSHFVEGDLITR